MSPLSKAFVVVVTVLSVLLVALVVPFVAKTQNYKQQLGAAENRAAAADQRARSAQSEISLLQSKESEQLIGLNDQVANLTAINSQLQQDNAGLRDQVAQQQAEMAARNAELASFAASTKQQAQLLEAITNELNTSRSKLVALQTQVIELSDRNNELNAQLDGFARQVRQFKENSVAAEQRAEQLESAIAKLPDDIRIPIIDTSGGTGTTGRIVPDVPIVGNVTLIEDLGGGLTLVQVDVGSKDGVEKDMEFLVHRGEMFLGTLVIEKVDTSDSAGRLDLIAGAINKGDSIYAGRF